MKKCYIFIGFTQVRNKRHYGVYTIVIGHAMATVRKQRDRHKMNRTAISDKPCLPFFAKAKEKQRHTQANAS